MTYIAALRSPEGIVISADTQESYEISGQVTYVEKIVVHRAPSYQTAIAGAGIGTLIDGFIQLVNDRIDRDSPNNEEELRHTVTDALLSFYETDVRRFRTRTKGVQFLIAATRGDGTTAHLWRTSGQRLINVPERAAIGHSAPFATYLLKRLYRGQLPLSQMVLLSVYLTAISKGGQLHVGGDTQLVVVRDMGILPENSEYVEEMEDRLREYESGINALLLSCADTSISVPAFQRLVDDFGSAAVRLHRSHIDRFVSSLTLETMIHTNDAYDRLPGPHVLRIGLDGIEIEHDEEKTRQHLERIKGMIADVRWPPRYVQCHKCGAEIEYNTPPNEHKLVSSVEMNLKEHSGISYRGENRIIHGTLECTDCKAINPTNGTVVSYRKIGAAEWITPSTEQK